MLVEEKTSIYLAIGLSLREISCVLRARSFACANDANIARSRNAQCKTRESPQSIAEFHCPHPKFFRCGNNIHILVCTPYT